MITIHSALPRAPELRSPDIYFTQAYGLVSEISDGGTWMLLEALDGGWQIPLIVNNIDERSRDAASPYGYSGVFADPSLSASTIETAWAASIETLRDLRIVSVFLRHSPIRHQATAHKDQIPVVNSHPTVLLRTAALEELWAGLAGRCRTAIRKARNHGLTCTITNADHATLSPQGAFRQLYEGTMRSQNAASWYTFPDLYYERLLSELAHVLLIAQVRDPSGTIVAASLLIHHGDTLHYHLSGSSMDGARLGATNLLLWTACEWASESGIIQFHLGGGIGPDDSLYRFKRSFGGHVLSYNATGLIVDLPTYQKFSHRKAVPDELSVDALGTGGFFPAYRAGDHQ